MTRDEIYDHLAQVYLGKKNKDLRKKNRFSAWLVINILITVVIFGSSIYGLTAFLTHRSDILQNRIIYSLNHGPIRVKYHLGHPYPSMKAFSLSIPQINVSKYKKIEFAVRGLEEGYPGVIRIELKNKKNERSSVFVKAIRLDWKKVAIPFSEFEKITDWSNLEEVSFILEAWNAEKKKGIILIDNVCFSS